MPTMWYTVCLLCGIRCAYYVVYNVPNMWYTVCLLCGIRCAYYVVYGVHVLSSGYLSAVGRLFHRNARQCSFKQMVLANASDVVCS